AAENGNCLDDPVALRPPGQGGVLAQREMSPRSVVVVDVALHDTAKLLFASDDDVVETFSPDRTDHPFGITVLPGRSCRNTTPHRPRLVRHGERKVARSH